MSEETLAGGVLDIAVKLTDQEVDRGSTADWLRAFRRNYRHIAATIRFLPAATREGADKVTDQDIGSVKRT